MQVQVGKRYKDQQGNVHKIVESMFHEPTQQTVFESEFCDFFDVTGICLSCPDYMTADHKLIEEV